MRDKFVMIISFILLLTLGAYSQDEEEENPHLEMVDDQLVCLDCHTDIPKEGETSPTYFLVDLPSENCLGCHSEIEHAGVKEHEGKDAKPLPGDENEKIACFTCHDPHPGGVIKGRVVYEAHINERSKQFLEFIVFPYIEQKVGKEVEYKPETEVYLREPVTENRICVVCHEPVYKTDWRRYITWDKFSRPFSY